MDGWYCVRIRDDAIDRNFRKRLLEEHRNRGSLPDCKIYYGQVSPGVIDYYFSPVAVEHYSTLIALWQGYKCVSPGDLERMQFVCG
jgi:hypothetical protein